MTGPTTPIFNWPYQALLDSPNGASLGENLALAVEATVADLDASLAVISTQVAALEVYRARQTLTGTASSITFSGIPADLRTLKVSWRARSDVVINALAMSMRVNNDSGANYDSQYVQGVQATAPTSVATSNATSQYVGLIQGTSSAGVWASGIIDFVAWDNLTGNYLNYLWRHMALDITAAGSFTSHGAAAYTAAGPYTRLDFFPSSGNFIAGTDFQLEGIYT